ncbi:sugar phosphate isomerase/epimerase [Amorphus sp. 3PC139-8]
MRSHSLYDQITAAASTGFSAIAINSAGYVAARSSGMTASRIRETLHDCGMTVSWVDAVTGWLPVRFPPRSPELKGFLDHELDIAFEIAAELGAEGLLAIGSFDHGAVDRSRQIDCFGQLCERAAGNDLRVGLEPIPFWGIPTLRAALEIVDTVGAPNGGLMLDSWHFYRGDPDIALLERVPGEKIFGVQLADAEWEVRGDLQQDCLEHRLLPGDGDFPLDAFMSRLVRMGVRDFGPEVFSARLDALSAEEAAQRSAQAVRAVLIKHGVEAA